MQLQNKIEPSNNGDKDEPMERTPAESNRLHTDQQVALQVYT